MTKWHPRVLTQRERLLAALTLAHPAADVALQERYRTFLRLNSLENTPVPEAFALVAAQWRTDGLMGSSIVSYLMRLLRFLPDLSAAEYRETRRIISRVEYTYRHDVVCRAPEITSGDYGKLLRDLKDPYVRVMVELMYATALRAGDLNDVAPWEVDVVEEEGVWKASIQLCGGKTHRRFGDRDLVSAQISPFVAEYLATVKQAGVRRILNVSTADISSAISEVLKRKATSYSIRNFRIMEIIKEETDDRGITDFHAVRMVTKHRNESALRSAYQQPVRRRLATS